MKGIIALALAIVVYSIVLINFELDWETVTVLMCVTFLQFLATLK